MSHNTQAKFYTSDLVDYGVYSEKETGNTFYDKKTIGGKWYGVIEDKLIEQTNLVIASIGTMFGIRYTLKGKNKKESLEIVNRVEFPSPYTESKRVKRIYSEFTCISETNERLPSFFSFDSAEDLKEGAFDFVVLHEEKELLRKRLTIQIANKSVFTTL